MPAFLENGDLVFLETVSDAAGIYGSKKEIGYEDKFNRHYMGRVYDKYKASPYVGYGAKEIATMGVQGVLTNKWQMAADKDYLDLTLGILATQ